MTDYSKLPTDEISAQAFPVTSDPNAPIDITPQLLGAVKGAAGPIAPNLYGAVNGTIGTLTGSGKKGWMDNVADAYAQYKTMLQQAQEQHPAEVAQGAAIPEAILTGFGLKTVIGKAADYINNQGSNTQAGSGTPEVPQPKSQFEQVMETPVQQYINDWKAKRLTEDYINSGLPTRPANEGKNFDPTIHMTESQIADAAAAFKGGSPIKQTQDYSSVTPSTDSPVPYSVSQLDPNLKATGDTFFKNRADTAQWRQISDNPSKGQPGYPTGNPTQYGIPVDLGHNVTRTAANDALSLPSPLTPQMQASWDRIKEQHGIQSYQEVVDAAKRHFPNAMLESQIAARMDALRERLINGTPQPNPNPMAVPADRSINAEWVK